MKILKPVRAVLAVGLVGALALGMAGCSGGDAATVNGVAIKESTITDYVQNFRKASDLLEEDAWGQWMADNGMDPSTVREQVVDYYVGQELLRQAAKENNVSVDSSEVDETVENMKANYESDEAWNEALAQAGTDEATYRESVEMGLLEDKLADVVTASEGPSDEELLEYAQMYATTYNGAKRSSHILFAAGDEATAQSVLDQINNGSLDFAAAAQQYSQDTGSAANGGDVGWDKLSNFVTEYTDALNTLSKDQVSGLVTSEYGIHIIKCTDVFNAPETVTSLDQLPSEFVDSIRSMAEGSATSTAFSDWYNEYKENADIVINDMPSNLPYDLDMSKYTDTDESAQTEDSATTEQPAEGESADAAAAEGQPAAEGEAAGETADTAAADAAAPAEGAGEASAEAAA